MTSSNQSIGGTPITALYFPLFAQDSNVGFQQSYLPVLHKPTSHRSAPYTVSVPPNPNLENQRNAFETLINTVKELNTMMVGLNKSIGQLTSRLENEQEKNQALNDKVVRLQNELDGNVNRLIVQKTLREAFQKKVESKVKTLEEDLKTKLAMQESHKEALKRKMTKVEEEIEKLKSEFSKTASQLQLKTLETDLQVLQNKVYQKVSLTDLDSEESLPSGMKRDGSPI